MCSAGLGAEPEEGHRVGPLRFKLTDALSGPYRVYTNPPLIMASFVYRKGHYTRALEEAIQTHNSQWPQPWNGKNPLHGGGSFNKMTPEERVRVNEICRNFC